MGLPSSGIEYDVLSVRREMSVARSVPVALSPVSMMDSVGAGRIGLRVLTPMIGEASFNPIACSVLDRGDGRMRGVLLGECYHCCFALVGTIVGK